MVSVITPQGPRIIPTMATIDQEFAALGAKYHWNQNTIDWMTSPTGLAAQSIADFIEAASNPDSWDEIVKVIKPAGAAGAQFNTLQQASRLRQAWRALKESEAAASAVRKRGADETDLDALLGQQELEDLQDQHHARYKVVFPPTIAPGDVLVSRIAREMEKRLLMPKDVWKTKTQAQQQRLVRKRTKVSDNVELVTHEAEDDNEDSVQDLVHYMAKLFTLLVAYTLAGIKKIPSTGGAQQPEKRTSRSTAYVECPLDVVYRYYFRVQNRAFRLAPAMALEWIQQRDEDEREMWIDKYRNSDSTLGQVIAETYAQREAMWELPTPQQAVPRDRLKDTGKQNEQDKATEKDKDKDRKKKPDERKKGARKVAKQLRDGTKLCQDYQHNKCRKQKERQCEKGKHCCGGVCKSGRVCGGPHPANACRNKAVLH